MDRFMMHLRYVALVACSLLASFLNLFLAPVVVLFADEAGWLPRWLWWFQTPDNPLDGDGGWKTEHRRYKIEDKAWKRWYNRTTWLYRNSMYGFCIDILGANVLSTDVLIVTGDLATSNRPLHDGLCQRVVLRDGKPIYFQYYRVLRWSDTYCLRINLGWKLWGDYLSENNQLTFSPNPFMGFSV